MNSLKDRSGNGFLGHETVTTWTPEEWRAFLSEVETEILALKEVLLSLPGQKLSRRPRP